MKIETPKQLRILQAYAQDRSKGGFDTFCHGFGNVLGGFRTEKCLKWDVFSLLA